MLSRGLTLGLGSRQGGAEVRGGDVEPAAYDSLELVVRILVGLEAHGGHVASTAVVSEGEGWKATLKRALLPAQTEGRE